MILIICLNDMGENERSMLREEYLGIIISRNGIKFVDTYSKIVMGKDCEQEQIPYEECKVIKVDYITNDAIEY